MSEGSGGGGGKGWGRGRGPARGSPERGRARGSPEPRREGPLPEGVHLPACPGSHKATYLSRYLEFVMPRPAYFKESMSQALVVDAVSKLLSNYVNAVYNFTLYTGTMYDEEED